MEETIVNRVANSGIVTLDLEEYYFTGPRKEIDIKNVLFMGLVLKEKDFRDYIKQHNWEEYRDAAVYVHCSADAIVPTWAYMLIATKLTGIAYHYVFGDRETLESSLFQKKLSALNPDEYLDKRVVIKGCGDQPISEAAFVEASRILLPVVKTLMFGEPCSTVPVYKKA